MIFRRTYYQPTVLVDMYQIRCQVGTTRNNAVDPHLGSMMLSETQITTPKNHGHGMFVKTDRLWWDGPIEVVSVYEEMG